MSMDKTIKIQNYGITAILTLLLAIGGAVWHNGRIAATVDTAITELKENNKEIKVAIAKMDERVSKLETGGSQNLQAHILSDIRDQTLNDKRLDRLETAIMEIPKQMNEIQVKVSAISQRLNDCFGHEAVVKKDP